MIEPMTDYELRKSGEGRKLERFGPYLIDRPCLQAVWPKEDDKWRSDALFTRNPDGKWTFEKLLPEQWVIEIDGIRFKLSCTDFGHLGIFPEQRESWQWIQKRCALAGRPLNVLNLFAYSGGSTLAAAKGGAQVTHLDASKKMVGWAKENAELNGLSTIRWIVDDVRKFLKREIKRERRYDGIILDPPSFGRGSKGEVFKIESDLNDILGACFALLSETPEFFLLSCHSPGFTPLVLHHLLKRRFSERKMEWGEMVLEGEDVLSIPSGCYARWRR